jgi:hypothetical protein
MPNKIITRKNGVDTVLLDVSQTTATEEKVLKGEVFTKADGTQAEGTLEGYQMSLSDDGTEINFVWGGAKKNVTLTIEEKNYHDYPTGQSTYLSLTKPTSADDYDYNNWVSSFPASVSIPAGSTVYIWGYNYWLNGDWAGCGETYDTAAEIVITEDTTISLLYTVGGGGSGD